MLEIEHRVTLLRIPVIFRRSIDIAVTHRVIHLRIVVELPDLSLRHILHLIEVLVVRRYVDTAAPAAGTVVIEAVRVRHVRAVYVKLVVVESFVLRRGFACPYTVLVTGEFIFHSSYVQQHHLRVRR